MKNNDYADKIPDVWRDATQLANGNLEGLVTTTKPPRLQVSQKTISRDRLSSVAYFRFKPTGALSSAIHFVIAQHENHSHLHAHAASTQGR